jgi:hypothetical protein
MSRLKRLVAIVLGPAQGARSEQDKRRLQTIMFVITAILLFAVFPTAMSPFRLNLVGKYLTYAFVALGLVLCWGYGGILSLGQGVFFGLGGYCMAMFLKLEASDPVSTAIQSTPGIPDFMDWNQLTELPALWVPFQSLPFTLLAIVLGSGRVGIPVGGRHVPTPCGRRVFRDHHAGGGRDLVDLDHRPSGLHRRCQRYHRPEDAGWLGHPHRLGAPDPLLRQRRAAAGQRAAVSRPLAE